MVVSQMDHRFDCEAAVLTSNTRCRSKLILNNMFVYDHKQARAQDGAENLGPKVHEGHSSPFIWIAQIAALGNWHDLAFVPFEEIPLLIPI